MPEKPTNQEEEYFAREEIEKKRALALKQADELATKAKEDLKALHFMHCPKCGMQLQTLHRGDVEIDTCFNCKGIWLDQGELDAMMKQGSPSAGAVMKAVLNIFNRK